MGAPCAPTSWHSVEYSASNAGYPTWVPDLPGTQEQLVLGVHITAEVLLQLAPRLVQVGAAQCRATSPAP